MNQEDFLNALLEMKMLRMNKSVLMKNLHFQKKLELMWFHEIVVLHTVGVKNLADAFLHSLADKLILIT
jgi:hypothetical protein